MWWDHLIRPSLVPAVTGALAYGAAQALLFQWNTGWFLNTGRGVGAVFGVIAATTTVYVLASSRSVAPAMLASLALAAGASAAMTVTFAVIGFTNIFPILLAIGTLIMTTAAILGGLVGYGLRRVWFQGAERGGR
jgi:hypothetical protein